MKKDFKDFVGFCSACFFCGLFVFILFLIVYAAVNEVKDNVVQELCERQQYDFCEVVKIEYKLKELKQDD